MINQTTQKNDDLDYFSKLMRQKLEESLEIVLNQFTILAQQYEQYLQQSHADGIKATER